MGNSAAVNWLSFLAEPKIFRICKKPFFANPESGTFARRISTYLDSLSCKFLKFRFLKETFLAARPAGGYRQTHFYNIRAFCRRELAVISCRSEDFKNLQEVLLRNSGIRHFCKKNFYLCGFSFLQISEIQVFARSISCGAPTARTIGCEAFGGAPTARAARRQPIPSAPAAGQ